MQDYDTFKELLRRLQRQEAGAFQQPDQDTQNAFKEMLRTTNPEYLQEEADVPPVPTQVGGIGQEESPDQIGVQAPPMAAGQPQMGNAESLMERLRRLKGMR